MSPQNLKSHLNSLIRLEAAYQEWLIEKNHIRKLAIKHKTKPTSLTKYIKEKGHRLESINIHMFDDIDTEEKAYWLGFLFADGSIDKNRPILELSLKLSDQGHLQKFKNFLESSNNIVTDSFRCRFTCGNKHFVDRLIQLGCTPKKSFTIEYPNIPKHLNKHFIRGFFDGDGCITRKDGYLIWNCASLACGSKNFMESVKTLLTIEVNCINLKIYTKKPNLHNLPFNQGNYKKLAVWLYENSKIYLDRKYDRYQNSIAVLLRD